MSNIEHLLQGIRFEPSARPLPCYRLLLLNAADGANSAAVGAALGRILSSLKELADGRVPELEGQPAKHAESTREQFCGLQIAVGYGRRFFDHEPSLTTAARPDFLVYLDASSNAFPALPWVVDAHRRNAEADIALQLTGKRDAAVNCAAVEVWKLISDEKMPLHVHEFFAGFGRHDGRGWLEFHDGVSNIESSERLSALEAPPDPAWMEGGTYMAFLRVQIELASWRLLSRAQQELAVGRDKLTGAALVAVDEDTAGTTIPVAAPAPGPDPTPEERANWRDPPQTTVPILEASHIHRANQSRASPGAPNAYRIFRQGYDFLDAITPTGPRLGLNFVSFQRDLRALQHLLHLPGWLGDSNFGGDAGALFTLEAGGFYALPPQADPFPGAGLFTN